MGNNSSICENAPENRSRGTRCGGRRLKSSVGYSNVLGLHIYSSLTDSPKQLAFLQAPLMLSSLYSCVLFNHLYHIFTVLFLYLDMFRHTNTYHCGMIASSIQYGNILYSFVAEEPEALTCGLIV